MANVEKENACKPQIDQELQDDIVRKCFDLYDYVKISVWHIMDDDEDPWFMLDELERYFGFSKSEMLSKLTKDEQSTWLLQMGEDSCYVPPVPVKNDDIFISESGFYKILSYSNLPEVKVFKDWVKNVALKQIRETGVYFSKEWFISECYCCYCINLLEERNSFQKSQPKDAVAENDDIYEILRSIRRLDVYVSKKITNEQIYNAAKTVDFYNYSWRAFFRKNQSKFYLFEFLNDVYRSMETNSKQHTPQMIKTV